MRRKGTTIIKTVNNFTVSVHSDVFRRLRREAPLMEIFIDALMEVHLGIPLYTSCIYIYIYEVYNGILR